MVGNPGHRGRRAGGGSGDRLQHAAGQRGRPRQRRGEPGQNAPGALSIALVVPPNFQINTISYQLTKMDFSQAGSLNVAQSGAVSAVLGGIPAGTGYTLALTANDVAGKFTSCAGSSTVSVTGGATTPVSVAIDCHLPPVPVTTPPQVPIPMPAVALLALALLGAGAAATRGAKRAQPAKPAKPDRLRVVASATPLSRNWQNVASREGLSMTDATPHERRVHS